MNATLFPIEKPQNKYGLKGISIFSETRNDKEILYCMDEDTYEELIASWAFHCLHSNGYDYEDVLRLGGAGDGGMDIIAFYNQADEDCDIFQCKHYQSAIKLSDVIAELGKFLYNIYTEYLPTPRSYYLMAPKGLTSKFTIIYTNASKLKKTIINNWDSKIAMNISKNKIIKYEGGLISFLESFDYSKFKFYSPDKLITDIRKRENRHIYNQYFGVRKGELERIKKEVPNEYIDYESVYITHLIDAYNDVERTELITSKNVSESKYSKHFIRSREEFWLAESVKKMSEENCPGDNDEFSELEDDMYRHIADTYEDVYENAYKRVKAVTDKATSFVRKERIISGELGSSELKGVCFQLSNENKLIWKEK